MLRFDVKKADVVAKYDCKLTHQPSTLAIFPDNKGFIVGSSEGRCSLSHFEKSSDDFVFKCHRNNEQVYNRLIIF